MSMSQPEDILLRLQDLEVTIDVRGGRVAPLRGCSMEVRRGETIGLVGESGSGKTMTALSIMGLLPHGGRVTGGSIVFNGRDLTSSPPDETRRIRGMDIGMIFVAQFGSQLWFAYRPCPPRLVASITDWESMRN